MGTNYYRILTEEEIKLRKEALIKEVASINLTTDSIFAGFKTPGKMDTWNEEVNPWERFIDETRIHLGKRSGGWKFLWNFHKNKYYSNKEELFEFIRNGRVSDEYGEEINVEEFIQMALDWGQPDGYDIQTYYENNPRHNSPWYDWKKYKDKYIDGLRVSYSEDFS